MFYVLWASAPFVITAHLRHLTPPARRSTDHLLRWAEKIPHEQDIYFKTFSWHGFYRSTVVPVGELRRTARRLDIANLERVGERGEKRLFYVGRERGKSVRRAVWERIWASIPAG